MLLQKKIPRLVIAALGRGSGKSTISAGLIRALRMHGLKVQAYKKGPDYLDPIWLSLASGKQCYNLDPHMFQTDLPAYIASHSEEADISVIEGNQGIYDSPDPDGKGSTADLAKTLQSPVILVVDTTGANRTIAALIKGIIDFDPDVQIAGIILNNVRGPRHGKKIVEAVEQNTTVPILGIIQKNTNIVMKMRHLGLVPAEEKEDADKTLSLLGDHFKQGADIQALIEIANSSPAWDIEKPLKSPTVSRKIGKIAVAKDEAFNFYYPDNFDALREQGLDLVFFSPLHDTVLPEASGMYLGGGYPEVFAEKLSNNTSMMHSIRRASQNLLPIYAECGGLIYLSKSIELEKNRYDLLNLLPLEIVMTQESQARGYVQLETLSPPEEFTFWKLPNNLKFTAHEFHYTKAVGIANDIHYAFQVNRGAGIAQKKDGILTKNILASYAHIHALAAPWWAPAFASAINAYQNAI